jgi:hypothetical protein
VTVEKVTSRVAGLIGLPEVFSIVCSFAYMELSAEASPVCQ